MRAIPIRPQVIYRPILIVLSLLAVFSWHPVLLAQATDDTSPDDRATTGAPAGLTMEATAAFGGYFKYGEWLPVWVLLENTGGDLEAEIQVRVTGGYYVSTFATSISLPSGSRKQVPIYVLPNNFSRQLEVRLVSTGQDELLLSQNVAVKAQPNINLLIGLVTPQRGALSLIASAPSAQINRPVVLIDVPISDLPERLEGFSSLDCLVINDVDSSSLNPRQQAALEAWVRHGGRLVIGGGAGARQAVSGLPESLLPLIPRQETQVKTLPGLSSLGGGEAVRVLGPFLVASGDLAEGRDLAAQGGLPLVRERAVGQGYVDFVALDLAHSPFDAWAGVGPFWNKLVLENATYPSDLPSDVSPRQMSADQLAYALTNLPSLALPSVKGLSVLLGVYIVIVGPANYALLRWRRRMHWAWITIPLITILFSGSAFGLGYLLRGTDLILNKIAIVAAQPDGTAWVNTYMGLFSPAQQSYEIEVRGSGLLSPLDTSGYGRFGLVADVSSPGGEVVFVQGDPGILRGLAVNQWSMQTFMIEDTWPELGTVSGDLHFADRILVGTVRNDTQLTLQDAVVILGSDFVRLGDLAPGEQAEVRLVLSALNSQIFGPPISYRLFEDAFNQSGPAGPPRDAQIKQQILDSLLNQGTKFGPLSSLRSSPGSSTLQGLFFLGWFDRSPPEVRVAGREPAQQTTGLLFAPLSYSLGDQESISVPPGFVTGSIIQMPAEGGTCGSTNTPSVYIGRGEAVFDFQLPQDMNDIQIDRIILSVNSDGGWQRPAKTELYNWDKDTWVELEDAILGDNVIAETGGLVRQDGIVRTRVAVETNDRGGCFYLGLGFEGTR
ncbi:MAG: hypothetical protein JXA89_22430 [Anaerolineae bacterium]|nr:hypothetical protein [Anaerolineae bacterium]